MLRTTLFCLSFFICTQAHTQGKRFTEEHKKRQLDEMSEGILLVPVYRTQDNSGVQVVNAQNSSDIKSAHNNAIIYAFENHYPFGDVLYYFEDQWLELMQGHQDGVLLNSELQPVDTTTIDEQVFFTARFEPAGWDMKSDIRQKKAATKDLRRDQNAYFPHLPDALPDNKKMIIPLYSARESSARNMDEKLLSDVLSGKNRQIVEEITKQDSNYEIFYFYENNWKQVEDGNLNGFLLNERLKPIDAGNLNYDSLYLYQPAFSPVPNDEKKQTAFDVEMAIMNPNSSLYPALIVGRQYDMLSPKNNRWTFLINFHHAYRLNLSSDLEESYTNAVNGLVNSLTKKMEALDIRPFPSGSVEK